MRINRSSKLPLILAGSAFGGAVAYLFATESGRNLRRSMREINLNDLPNKVDEAREYVERQGLNLTRQLRDFLDKTKDSVEAGRKTYFEAEAEYREQIRRIENRNREIVSNVHRTVDNVNKTANTLEASVLDPLYEIAALIKGFDRCVRNFFGQERRPTPAFRGEEMRG